MAAAGVFAAEGDRGVAQEAPAQAGGVQSDQVVTMAVQLCQAARGGEFVFAEARKDRGDVAAVVIGDARLG